MAKYIPDLCQFPAWANHLRKVPVPYEALKLADWFLEASGGSHADAVKSANDCARACIRGTPAEALRKVNAAWVICFMRAYGSEPFEMIPQLPWKGRVAPLNIRDFAPVIPKMDLDVLKRTRSA